MYIVCQIVYRFLKTMRNEHQRMITIRQAVPFVIVFFVAFGLSFGFWRAIYKEPDYNINIPRKGNTLVKVKEISKDLRSQLDYVHEQNRKIHRARNLAIDKMVRIQRQKDKEVKKAREYAKKVRLKEWQLRQEKKKGNLLKKEIKSLKFDVLKMQELHRLTKQQWEAHKAENERLQRDNEALRRKLKLKPQKRYPVRKLKKNRNPVRKLQKKRPPARKPQKKRKPVGKPQKKINQARKPQKKRKPVGKTQKKINQVRKPQKKRNPLRKPKQKRSPARKPPKKRKPVRNLKKKNKKNKKKKTLVQKFNEKKKNLEKKHRHKRNADVKPRGKDEAYYVDQE